MFIIPCYIICAMEYCKRICNSALGLSDNTFCFSLKRMLQRSLDLVGLF